jgi:hypothetical protein
MVIIWLWSARTEETDMPSPTRYKIETLLAEGVQPFDDIDAYAFDALADGMKDRKELTVPVVLSKDGVLLDGHQRLRALLRNGRTFINAADVKIEPSANAENALEWAVKLNMVRRHYTMEDKAQAARRLQREYGWSQRTIAAFFGVSQPAVSQWFAASPDTEAPEEITGADGKRYRTRRRQRPRPPAGPALPEWVAMAGQLVRMLPVHWGEVPEVHHTEAREVLEDLAEVVAAQLAGPGAPEPFVD